MAATAAPAAAEDGTLLSAAYAQLRAALANRDDWPLPPASAMQAASDALPQPSQADYLKPRGPRATLAHILDAVVPALNGQNLSGRYYGFVTGSTLPVAEAADNVVSALDQNVQVHLPEQSVGTAVEDAALDMLVGLLELGGPPGVWAGRTFTTGATASNVLGLALGREAVVARRLPGPHSVAELGLLAACRAAGVRDVQVLTSMGHSSLYKAAGLVGLGRAAVKELRLSDAEPWRLDVAAVERELSHDSRVANIIVVSAGEVNTGKFASTLADMQQLRAMSDRYHAWLHVDGGT